MFRTLALVVLLSSLGSCKLIGFAVAGETPSFGDAPKVRKVLVEEFQHIEDQKVYQDAVKANTDIGRNQFVRHYAVRIQNYHELMNNDIFTNSAITGSSLDVLAVAAAAIATAVAPAATKTWWAAVATVAGGTRLALSKNILQEKSSNVVLATMIAERATKWKAIRDEMKKSLAEYQLDVAVVDLSDYMNTGSLDKSAATVEANAQKTAQDLKEAASH